MMRKDAKLSFIIGGILVAVLIVYVLVPGKKHGQGVTLDEGNKTDQAIAPDASTPGSTADASKAIESPAGAIPANTPPTTAPVAKATDPFTANPGDQSKGTDEDKWMLALNRGNVLPAMMTSAAPVSTSSHTGAIAHKPAAAPESTDVKSAATPTPEIAASASSAASTDAAAPATQPIAAAGKQNTHVVQSGETLSSIAKVAYGSANFWPYIVRANPGIVDKKIKPGMTINLPADADVKTGAAAGSAGSSAATPAAEVKIDPATQYEVQSGDSLAKIAMKLYGSSSKWQQIYDLNKETIGNDPQKLKLKTVLKLPEAPTVKS